MMKNETQAPKTIDAYIAGFPPDVQKILQEVRSAIKAAAPQAVETIKYGIPTFVLNGNLVHFGGYKNHVGFYPAPSALEKFSNDLSAYQTSKGTVKFPLDRPIPYDLISRMTAFRAVENLEKAKPKKG